MPRRFLLVWTAFALVVSVEITGCSLIGFGIGSAIDAGRVGRLRPGDRTVLFKLEPGSRILVRRADGTTIAGVYRGLETQPDSEYLRRYAAWADTAQLAFRAPRIGETVRIEGGDGRTMAAKAREVTFLGFGPQRIHYRPRRSKATYEPFKSLRGIRDSSGHVISKAALTQVSGRLPTQLIAIIREGQTEREVDLLDDRLVELRFAEMHHGFRTAGFIVGITVDATLLVAAAALSSSSSSTSCSPSYTGGGYYTLREMPAPMDASQDSIYVMPSTGLALAMRH